MAELGYFEIGCKKLHFEKNDFEIFETDFWDFWEKSILKHFLHRTIRERCVLGVFSTAQYVFEVYFIGRRLLLAL